MDRDSPETLTPQTHAVPGHTSRVCPTHPAGVSWYCMGVSVTPSIYTEGFGVDRRRTTAFLVSNPVIYLASVSLWFGLFFLVLETVLMA